MGRYLGRICSASAATSELCEWVQFGIDVYMPYHMYRVKSHSSPWFSTDCTAAIIHRNHFFRWGTHLYMSLFLSVYLTILLLIGMVFVII